MAIAIGETTTGKPMAQSNAPSSAQEFLDLKKAYQFYKFFHSNRVNIWIHVYGIPTIMWSYLVLLQTDTDRWEKNAAIYVTAFYTIYYFILDIPRGFILNCFTWAVCYHAWHFKQTNEHAVWWALAVNASSWIAQFIGHGVFERKRPALMDSLAQAFLIAPMFVLIDIEKIILGKTNLD